MNGLRKTTRANFPFSDRPRRNRHSNERPKAPPKRQDFFLEPLESRLLLSADLLGVPAWVDQGPGPIENGNNVILTLPGQNSPQDGAVHAIAADPSNANRVFIATVNGGLWRSTNATFSRFDGADNDGDGVNDEADETPTWTPLTDQYPSLSFGAIALSPLDPNTLFAGTARTSSGGDGGPLTGMLRSTDGGDTWIAIGGTTFNGQNIERIVPTALGGTLANQVVLTAGGNGIMRSVDGGQTWNQISGTLATSDGLDNNADGTIDELGELNLPGGYFTDVVADPTNTNRFTQRGRARPSYRGEFSSAPMAALVGPWSTRDLPLAAASGPTALSCRCRRPMAKSTRP